MSVILSLTPTQDSINLNLMKDSSLEFDFYQDNRINPNPKKNSGLEFDSLPKTGPRLQNMT